MCKNLHKKDTILKLIFNFVNYIYCIWLEERLFVYLIVTLMFLLVYNKQRKLKFGRWYLFHVFIHFKIAAVSLVFRRCIIGGEMCEHRNNIKTFQDFLKMTKNERFPKLENLISSVVCEILTYKLTTYTTLYSRIY